jgi:hypothetical protein
VLTWHNDNILSGLNNTETTLTLNNVNSASFGKLFDYTVDGYVYAQPLYKSNLVIGGTPHNVAFVATEGDSVYAVDTTSPATYWVRHFTDPANGITTVPSGDVNTGDIVPQVGITGTPVIDATTNTMYVLAKTKEVRADGNHYVQKLYAIDITTGLNKTNINGGNPYVIGDTKVGGQDGGYTDVTAISVPGVGDGTTGNNGNPPNTVFFNALREHHRASITMSGNTLYLVWASHGDNRPYHGWVISFNKNTLQPMAWFNTTPNAAASGIWQSGAGAAIDPDTGHLMFSLGNAFAVGGNPGFDPAKGDYSEAVLNLAPDLTLNQSTGYFVPFNWQALDNADEDLGSGGTMILPDSVGSAAHPHLAVETGKQGRIYLIDRDNLGGFTSGGPDKVVQVVDTQIAGVWGSPDFLPTGPNSGLIFYHGSGDSLKSIPIVAGVLQPQNVKSSGLSWGFPGAQPSNSANNGANAIVWELQLNTYADTTSHAILRAWNATTLTKLYYSTDAGQRDQLTSPVKFTVPTIADGRVLVGTNGEFSVFGLFPPATQVPDAPTNLAATAASPTSIILTWDPVPITGDKAATQIDIERSTDDVTFTQVAVVSPGATTYTDPGLTPATKYYYRIRAENNVGKGDYSNEANALTLLQAAQTFLLNILNNQVDIVWNSIPAVDSGYDIQRSDDGGQTWNDINFVPPSQLSYSDPGLNHQPYEYRVVAQATSGQSSVSNVVFADLTIGSSQIVHDDGNGSGFTNHDDMSTNGNVTAFVPPGFLLLTDGNGSEAGSSFHTTPVQIGDFQTTFTFRLHDGTSPRADGIGFVIQNSPQGAAALGSGGGGLGYGPDTNTLPPGIPNSLIVKFDLYSNQGEGTNSTGIFTEGRAPTVRAPGLDPSFPDQSIDLNAAPYNGIVNINDQHLKQVDLNYDSATKTLTEKITDLEVIPNQSVTITYNNVDLQSLIGSSTAYVGFTGGTGGLTVVSDVHTWTYNGQSGTPATPTNLFADPVSNPGQVDLTWNEISPVEQGFQLERSSDGGQTWTVIAVLPFNQPTYQDTPPGPGTYTYRVAAGNDLGLSGYAVSAPVAFEVPKAPSSLAANSNSPGAVSLTWLNNDPLNTTGFQVLRSVNTPDNFQVIATLSDPNAASYTDNTVQSNVTYYYEVVAFNDNGQSAFSNVAKVTVQSPYGGPPDLGLYYKFDETNNNTLIDFKNGWANHNDMAPGNGSAINFFAGNPPALQMTDNGGSEATSIYYGNSKVGTGNFTTSFTLQDQGNSNGTRADGLTFVLQNVSLTAVGGGGGALGYSGITNSVAVYFDIYSGGSHASTTGIFMNGNVDKTGAIDMGPSGIVLCPADGTPGHPMLITLNYSGTSLTETVKDTVTNAVFTHTYTVNIGQVIGSTSAWAGFTAGTGGETSIQKILNWSGSFSTPAGGNGSALDSSGKNNTGTVVGGVTYVPGVLDGAYKFDGTGYVTTNDMPLLDPTQAITVTAFVNATTWSNGNERILQKSTDNNDNQYRLLEEGGVLKWDITGVGTITAALPSVGVWHNVTGTYDGSMMILYVDGNIVAQAAASGPIAVTNGPLFVATKNAGAPLGDHFPGSIDEVRVYDRALSQSEIQMLPFGDQDIGTVEAAGSVTYSGPVDSRTYTQKASGNDIWNNADEFNFLYLPFHGDGMITARVNSIVETDFWAKGAVMYRANLTAGSPFVDMVLTPSPDHSEASLQWRDSQNGGPGSIDDGAGKAPLPYLIRLIRQGNLFTGQRSADGITWVTVGTHTSAMPADVYVGLAATAHNSSGVLTTVVYDKVSMDSVPDGLLGPAGGGASISGGGGGGSLARAPVGGLVGAAQAVTASKVGATGSSPITVTPPAGSGNAGAVPSWASLNLGKQPGLVLPDNPPTGKPDALDQVFAQGLFEVPQG